MNSNNGFLGRTGLVRVLFTAMAWLIAFGCAGLVHADEAAGKVISASGSVRIARNGLEFDAPRGTEVRAGDVLMVAAMSNAQILFADDATMALRADTVFRVDEFSYKGDDRGALQKAFFSLLKGGLRSITGLVGKRSHDDYRVTTPTSTIGVRGTNYQLVQCEDKCRNADGSLAAAGTYGQVSEGHIAVRNESGESLFGTNEFFHVSNTHAAPEKLIAPPIFLSDTLAGRRTHGPSSMAMVNGASNTGSAAGADAVSGAAVVALTGSGATSGDSMVTSNSAGAVVPAVVLAPVPTSFQSTSNISAAGPAALILPSGSSTVLYFNVQGVQVTGTCGSPPCGAISISEVFVTVNLAAQRAYVTSIFTDQSGGIFNLSTPLNSGGLPVSVSGSTVIFGGTVNVSDYPTQTGSFRCSTCGSGSTVGTLDTVSISGTLTPAQATMTLTGSNAFGSGGFTVNVPSATPPNVLGAAAVIPRSGGGSNAVGWTTWNVQTNASGALTGLGNTSGNNNAQVGSANNITVGTDSATGMVWGYWHGAGAHVVDSNYVSLTTGANSMIPWVVGPFTASAPTSLGTAVTFTPVGWVVNGTTGTLSSASLTADFVNRNMAVNITSSSTGAGASTYTMTGNSGFSATTGRFGAGFSGGSCTGGCNSANPSATLGGSFNGNFIGSSAQAAGLAFTFGYGLGNGVNGVIAFKR